METVYWDVVCDDMEEGVDKLDSHVLEVALRSYELIIGKERVLMNHHMNSCQERNMWTTVVCGKSILLITRHCTTDNVMIACHVKVIEDRSF